MLTCTTYNFFRTTSLYICGHFQNWQLCGLNGQFLVIETSYSFQKIVKIHSYTSDCVACKLYYIVIIMHNAILFRTPYVCIYTAKKKKRRRVVRLVLHRLKSPFWPSIHKIIDFIYWKSDVEFNFLQFGIFFLLFWQKKRPIRRGRKKVPNTVRFF